MLQISIKDHFQSVLHFLENLLAFFVLFQDGIQEPAAEKSNKSDDSPTSSETSPTVHRVLPNKVRNYLHEVNSNFQNKRHC